MSEEENPTPTPTPAPETTPEPDNQPKTFTQEQLDRLVGKGKTEAAKEAEKAALQKLSEDTGLSIDELKEMAKATKERQEAEKTELQRLQDEADRVKRESSEQLTTAQTERHKTLVKMCLLDTGVSLPEGRDERRQALDRLASLVTVSPGASEDDILTDIEDGVKKQFPALFQAPEEKPSGNPPSNPSGNPRKPLLGTSNPSDVGKSRAAQMNARRGVTPKPA